MSGALCREGQSARVVGSPALRSSSFEGWWREGRGICLSLAPTRSPTQGRTSGPHPPLPSIPAQPLAPALSSSNLSLHISPELLSPPSRGKMIGLAGLFIHSPSNPIHQLGWVFLGLCSNIVPTQQARWVCEKGACNSSCLKLKRHSEGDQTPEKDH